MPKRKASEVVTADEKTEVVSNVRRSNRRTTPKETRTRRDEEGEEVKKAPVKSKRADIRGKVCRSTGRKHGEDGVVEGGKVSFVTDPPKAIQVPETKNNEELSGRQFWLMKAEPETRMEKGKDVKFSIDDLAAKTEPEPWDGIRNYVARNNLRAMRKGDLAFFYHSNCKVPGIVGTMEIVKEHEPDLTSLDPRQPYHDPKDKPDRPKWSIVHVEFRRKFAQQISLAELKGWSRPGGPLEQMQMLTAARLSVSRVSPGEWGFLVGVAEEREKAGSG